MRLVTLAEADWLRAVAEGGGEKMETKVYLGDGAYAEWDGYGVWLTAENGIRATDHVYLEPDVYKALVAFVERVKEAQ